MNPLLLMAVRFGWAACVVVATAVTPALAQAVDPAPVAAMAPLPQAPSEQKRLTWEERFARANTTQDGKLTQDQARAGYKTIARQFDQIDRGHKGYVTEQDVRAWREANREKRRAQREAAQREAAQKEAGPKDAAQDPLRPRKAYQRTQSDQAGTVTTQVIGPQMAAPQVTGPQVTAPADKPAE